MPADERIEDGLDLVDRADGVPGHYCLSRNIDGHVSFWNPSGWAGSGYVFTDKELADSFLKMYRILFQTVLENQLLRGRK